MRVVVEAEEFLTCNKQVFLQFDRASANWSRRLSPGTEGVLEVAGRDHLAGFCSLLLRRLSTQLWPKAIGAWPRAFPDPPTARKSTAMMGSRLRQAGAQLLVCAGV